MHVIFHPSFSMGVLSPWEPGKPGGALQLHLPLGLPSVSATIDPSESFIWSGGRLLCLLPAEGNSHPSLDSGTRAPLGDNPVTVKLVEGPACNSRWY